MGLIPKIVSTPVKWASSKLLHSTLLRFPGGNSHSPIACTYCPEMCRFSCPTAVTSGNDAVTPCNKMGLLYREENWPEKLSQAGPLWPIYDCTGCGRCTEYCVYQMPVADQLFAARKTHAWSYAQEASLQFSDQSDPYGDLAEELGDQQNADRRLKAFINESHGKSILVREPRVQFYLQEKKLNSKLTLIDHLSLPVSKKVQEHLKQGTWLIHESVWLSRRLGIFELIRTWVDHASSVGIRLQLPFASGKDCIDCGGETAYSSLFPQQARQMAEEIWEKDSHRVDGILCFSPRCVKHLKASIPKKVPLLLFEDLFSSA